MLWTISIAMIAACVGGAWRFAFGHTWTPAAPAVPNFLQKHARTILHAIAALASAGLVYAQGGPLLAICFAAALTPAYFAIGNSSVIAGPYSPGGWAYARPMLLKYVAPALLANGVLWFLDYHTAIGVAGAIAALGYFAFWKFDLHGLDPWNEKAEALSGAAWFGALATVF